MVLSSRSHSISIPNSIPLNSEVYTIPYKFDINKPKSTQFHEKNFYHYALLICFLTYILVLWTIVYTSTYMNWQACTNPPSFWCMHAEGREHPIGYVSRALLPWECNYATVIYCKALVTQIQLDFWLDVDLAKCRSYKANSRLHTDNVIRRKHSALPKN